MTVSLSTACRNAKLDAITTTIGSNGLLRIYDGTAPANANTALSGNTKLAELALAATAAPTASGGVLTFSAIANDSSADATGTASFHRIYKSDGTTCVAQGTCATSGGDLNLNTLAIVAGGPVAVSSFVLTEGNP
jgi:hypothetical protein